MTAAKKAPVKSDRRAERLLHELDKARRVEEVIIAAGLLSEDDFNRARDIVDMSEWKKEEQ